jgi:hypothetical protein
MKQSHSQTPAKADTPAPDPDFVAQVRRAVTQEIYYALGLPRHWWGRRLLDPLFYLPAQRFAQKAARFDDEVARLGFAAAARNILRGIVERVGLYGAERIPAQGPVLLASNHPGAYDSFSLVTGLQRNDLRVVASGVDFTRSLPNMCERFIYVTQDPAVRMAAVRESLRHLQNGGVLLIFPTGLVDPDPALSPDQALQVLPTWHESVALFLRRVPQTQLVTTVVSHVLARVNLHNPLTRLVREDWQKRRLAEYLQVLQQFTFGKKFGLVPRVSYAQPWRGRDVPADELSAAILHGAEQALQTHVRLPENAYHYTLLA